MSNRDARASREAFQILESDASSYLRQCDIVVENLINPGIGTTLNLTLAQFNLAPGGGEWIGKAPEQGEQINFGGNPGQWGAANRTYPGPVDGFMTFAVQDHGTLRLEFHSSLTGFGATINGRSDVTVVNGFLFILRTTLNPESDQPIYTVKAIEYKKP